ncbi:MAG: dTMP kinase [Deltaproteobacteria bacterium]|nr:dTMP kinase [Deltaproteobacteria bacterium]
MNPRMEIWQDRYSKRFARGGAFFVFEGIDGSGKTTQARLLADRLEALGLTALRTAEPSDGPVGRLIRSASTRPGPHEEARLFAKDRNYHVEQIIIPALRRGVTVISDRYLYSSVAYQGARGVAIKEILSLNSGFLVKPDIIFLLLAPVETALARIKSERTEGYSQFEAVDYLRAVDRIYRSLDDPLICPVSGEGPADLVHERVFAALRERGLLDLLSNQ